MKTAYINGIILNGYEDMTLTLWLAVLVDGETITGVVPTGVSIRIYSNGFAGRLLHAWPN